MLVGEPDREKIEKKTKACTVMEKVKKRKRSLLLLRPQEEMMMKLRMKSRG